MKTRIGAIMVVQNDSETVERSLRSIYDHVDFVLVSNDPNMGWTGVPIVADNTLELIRSIDYARKVIILQENYCVCTDPIMNETRQRQTAVDLVSRQHPGLDWIVQVDADEEFLDFPSLAKRLGRLPSWTRQVFWRWVQIFNFTEDGRLIVVVDATGRPVLEHFPLAHRPYANLSDCRRVPLLRSHRLNRFLAVEYKPSIRMPIGQAALHYTFAKSEARIAEKLKTWGHSHQFDTAKYFELWKRSRTEWDSMRDVQYNTPSRWPALRAFTREELLR